MWRKLRSSSLILFWLLASWTVPLNAQKQSSAPTAHAVSQLMEDQPLSEATWPVWRDYYVRLFFVYDLGEPIEFYDQIHSFIGGIAAQNGGALHGKWANDSVAWIILSKHFEGSASGLELAVAASRQAMALDKNSAMSCQTLAGSLIRLVGQRAKTTLHVPSTT